MYMFITQSFSFVIFTVFIMLIVMIRLYSSAIYTMNVLSISIYIMHLKSLFSITVAVFI